MIKKWILGLDSLRIILAVIVLLSHLDTYSLFHSSSGGSLLKFIGFLFGNSFVGVCAVIAFFIVSGIVIHFPYECGKDMRAGSFLIKRFLRIGLPMIAVYVSAKLTAMPISHLPFWSLYCELIYYFLYPIILYVIRLHRKSLLGLFILSFIASYVIVTLEGTAIQDLFNNNKNLSADYWQFGTLATAMIGLPNWLLGVAIAKKFATLPKAIKITTTRIYTVRLGIFLLGMICSVARFHLSLSYTLSLNIFGLFAAYWIWEEINYWSGRPTINFLEQMGKISYSVYICHAIAIFIITSVLKNGVLTIGLEIIATFVLSYLFYLVVEKPSHKLAQKIS